MNVDKSRVEGVDIEIRLPHRRQPVRRRRGSLGAAGVRHLADRPFGRRRHRRGDAVRRPDRPRARTRRGGPIPEFKATGNLTYSNGAVLRLPPGPARSAKAAERLPDRRGRLRSTGSTSPTTASPAVILPRPRLELRFRASRARTSRCSAGHQPVRQVIRRSHRHYIGLSRALDAVQRRAVRRARAALHLGIKFKHVGLHRARRGG